jgi:ATP dependent DNA ligase domain
MPLHAVTVSEFRFIPPCRPVFAKAVPVGDGWVHEMKFDGYRVQAHKMGSRVVLFSRNGHDFTERFASIAALLREMPAKAAVLDGEVVVSDADGRPNFARLHVRWTRPGAIHLWAFDLLALNGQDLCSQPLVKRQARLQALLERFGCPAVSASETFADGMALLRASHRRSDKFDLESAYPAPGVFTNSHFHFRQNRTKTIWSRRGDVSKIPGLGSVTATRPLKGCLHAEVAVRQTLAEPYVDAPLWTHVCRRGSRMHPLPSVTLPGTQETLGEP